MKKLLFLSLCWCSLTATAADYQKVFEYNGSAQQIIASANKAFGAVKSKSIQGDTLVVQTKVNCMSGLSFMSVAIPFYGDIIVEAKDNRYRITFDNMKAESGYMLAQLPQNKESCEKSFAEFSDQINKKMGSFTDF